MDTLEIVKARLGIKSNKRDDYLNVIIKSVESELTDIHGIEIDVNDTVQKVFIADYSCFRYESKGESGGMPRHLQFRLHNLLIGNNNDNI